MKTKRKIGTSAFTVRLVVLDGCLYLLVEGPGAALKLSMHDARDFGGLLGEAAHNVMMGRAPFEDKPIDWKAVQSG